MSTFTSRRERNLWLSALVVVAAIYATLGLARTLADELSGVGLWVWLFIACCFLVLASILSHGLQLRPSGLEITVALGVLAAYLLVFVRMAIPAERSHLIEYGVVAVLVYEALLERARNGRNARFPALLAIVLTAWVGWIDEGLQLFMPSRVFDGRDILFNTLAAVMAVTASAALAWARMKARRSHS